MPFRLKEEKLKKTLIELQELMNRIKENEFFYEEQLKKVHPKYTKSARNLIHYRTMRADDITHLQKRLGNLGLSRLAKAQAHVQASMFVSNSVVRSLVTGQKIKSKRAFMGIKEATKLQKQNAKELLGYRSKGRRTRIMVTQPSSVANDYELVHQMVKAGMNAARINCAHDNEEVWLKMIHNIRKASAEIGKKVKITMDLGGPKIRTGSLVAGPRVVKFTPERDERGHILHPIMIWIGPEENLELSGHHIPASSKDLAPLEAGDQLYFKDTRRKTRSLHIVQKYPEGLMASCAESSYIETGMLLGISGKPGHKITVGEIPEIEQRILLEQGDQLLLHRATVPGEPAKYDAQGNLVAHSHISCTNPDIFDHVKPGEPIRFDDGKIEGTIKSVSKEEIWIDILRTKAGGSKLRADKGINLPLSNLEISGLTNKDKRDLAFVAQHADVVNMSFVNNVQDVRDLITEIDTHGARERLGVILKIETQSGFDNLTDILLEAMQLHPIGVMIARGDLAIEVGWDNIGRVQEEIMRLCQAAHITDVWATQVLESLAKKGIPSRAEITDATKAQRADCVMLNKGPFIVEAISLMDKILKGLEAYQDRNAPLTPKLEKAGS